MSLFSTLGIVLIRDLGQGVASTLAGRAPPEIVEHLREILRERRDGLLLAMRQANDRAWLALEIALAGESYAQQVNANPSSNQIQALKGFLEAGWFGKSTIDRARCLDQLRAARSVGTFDATPLSDREVDGVVSNLERYTDPVRRREGDQQTLSALVASLKSKCPDLARLMTEDNASGSPLLAVAASEFFRLALQADPVLATVPVLGVHAAQSEALANLTRFLLDLAMPTTAGSDSHGGIPSPDAPATTPTAIDASVEVQALLAKIRQRPDAGDLQKCAALLRQLRRESHPHALALLREVRQALAAHLSADTLTFLPRGSDRAGVMPARAVALARAIQFSLWDDPA